MGLAVSGNHIIEFTIDEPFKLDLRENEKLQNNEKSQSDYGKSNKSGTIVIRPFLRGTGCRRLSLAHQRRFKHSGRFSLAFFRTGYRHFFGIHLSLLAPVLQSYCKIKAL